MTLGGLGRSKAGDQGECERTGEYQREPRFAASLRFRTRQQRHAIVSSVSVPRGKYLSFLDCVSLCCFTAA